MKLRTWVLACLITLFAACANPPTLPDPPADRSFGISPTFQEAGDEDEIPWDLEGGAKVCVHLDGTDVCQLVTMLNPPYENQVTYTACPRHTTAQHTHVLLGTSFHIEAHFESWAIKYCTGPKVINGP